jgi:hypothetical protein
MARFSKQAPIWWHDMSMFENNLRETGIEEAAADELDETPATVQQAAPRLNTAADRSEPWDPDANLDAYVARLLANKSASNMNAVSSFMGAVVPWPETQKDPGWVVLQPSYALQKTKDGRGANGKFPIGKGKPFKDVSSAIGYANWITTKTQKDVWFCTSLQDKVGTDTKHNKPVGARSK